MVQLAAMTTTYPVARKRRGDPSPRPSPAVLQTLFALAGGIALFFLFCLILLLGSQLAYAGRIFPGVSVAGIDLSGMPPQEAAGLLASRLTFPDNGKIVFQEGQNVWVAKPVELGLFLDPQTMATSAYSVGRAGNPLKRPFDQLQAWYFGENLPPMLVYDERVAQRYLEGIAAQINLPTVEATLTINGNDVVVTPGQVGRTLISEAVLPALEDQLRSLTDGMLPLVVRETPPVILDAGAQAEIARKILSEPLVLQVPDAQEGDPGPWTFDRSALVKMLTIERVEGADGAQYQVALKADSLKPFLADLAPKLARQAADARFIFNDETGQLDVLQPSVTGRALNIESTLASVNEKVAQGEHQIPLVFDYTAPQVADTAKGKDLGITELVSSQTTYFYGSSTARMQNIETAAARFHGLLVPPGADFSMADALGDVSLDNGYAEALIIYGRPHHQGCWRRGLPGEHHAVPHDLLRRLSDRRAPPARLPGRLLRADRRRRLRRQAGRLGRHRVRPGG